MRAFWTNQAIYLLHVISLGLPGVPAPSVRAFQQAGQPLQGWSADDLSLMIDEGRRQSDRQLSALAELRSRAQWLFTAGVPIVVAVAAIFGEIDSWESGWWHLAWVIALAAVAYGVLGAVAIMVVRADFETIKTARLSTRTPPIDAVLAKDYADMMATGENTLATRLTLFRQAVLWVIFGGYLALVVWMSVR